jgi:DNA polymerase-1
MENLSCWPFNEIWCVDFEYGLVDGNKPEVRCMVAVELRSGRQIKLWADELESLRAAPFNVGGGSLFVAYFSSAEFSCFHALGWPLPTNVLDLFVEFRNMTNGLPTPSGNGLIGALAYFGMDAISVAEKTDMRDLALRGGNYTDAEKIGLIDYCKSDVGALIRLLPRLAEHTDLPRAILRGRYMKAVSVMESNGIPVDTATLERLKPHWETIKKLLIAKVDVDFGVYDGTTFKTDRFNIYLEQNNISWPRLPSPSNALDMKDDTFKEMARAYPQLEPLKQLRATLSGLKLHDIAVGVDGRNRCMLSPFRAKTSRNQPSNSKFIFGPASWIRHLIKPANGMAVAYIDWSQQEFGIAAALANDDRMKEAYTSGDPYLAFAKQAGAVPADATKQSHKADREKFKACVLATQYGMGEQSLAQRIGQPPIMARQLLKLHRETYPEFWKWSDDVSNFVMLNGYLHTTFGWRIQIHKDPNDRSLRNFPVQANGAEMLRLAACLIAEEGIRLCAPVHDAIVIEAPISDIDQVVCRAQELMATASKIILNGFELKSDCEIIRAPDRYEPERGTKMWETVLELLRQIEGANKVGAA